MRNIKLTIEYEGTNYHGWQVQENAVTVQGMMIRAIKGLTGENINLIGCSRTDVGVHAKGQIANFMTNASIPPDRISYALNRLLPADIVVRKSEEVDCDFHARFCSKGKTYRYLIYNSQFPSALLRNRACHVSHGLSLESMAKGASFIKGCHDFSAFRASGSDVKSSVRDVRSLELYREGDLIGMVISGDGFLYNMVRIIAGTLIEVGSGRFQPADVKDIMESRDRRRAGRTASAHGLYLEEIFY